MKVGHLVALFLPTAAFAFPFPGMDIGPLLQLVAGQVQEIERLTEQVGVARDQVQVLRDLNDGVQQTVTQIEQVQAIVERAQGLDPKSIRSLADLNDLLSRVNDLKYRIDELLSMKIAFTNQAILAGALQSDTAYKMGQELTFTGSRLAEESRHAPPGRASQITAASSSAQMVAQGVELQTLAQLVQLQALSLDFQKSQVERELVSEKNRRELYQRQLGSTVRKKKP